MNNPYAFCLAQRCVLSTIEILDLLPQTDLILHAKKIANLEKILLMEAANGEILIPDDLIAAGNYLQNTNKELERLKNGQKKSDRNIPIKKTSKEE